MPIKTIFTVVQCYHSGDIRDLLAHFLTAEEAIDYCTLQQEGCDEYTYMLTERELI